MVNHWSDVSMARLETCSPHLQLIFNKVLVVRDCSILCGFRNEEEQMEHFNADPPRTQLKFPDSNHNEFPSRAIDVVHYPVPDWELEIEEFIRFSHFVLGTAYGMGIALRWGGDWDRDFDLTDQRFNDYPHFELVGN